MRNTRDTVKSSDSLPGPDSRFLPEVPNVNGAGCANAAGLNQRLMLWSEPAEGLPTRFARVKPVPALGMSPPTVTPKGKPVCSVNMPDVCQPCITPFRIFWFERRGISYEADIVKRCR